MTSDPFTYADVLYRYAQRRGDRNRHIPITPSRDGIGGLAKTLAGFAVFFFLLGFGLRILWSL